MDPSNPLTPLLSLTVLLATYLFMRCWTPPNPNSKARVSASKDRTAFALNNTFLTLFNGTALLIGVYHAILVYKPARLSPLICPNNSNLNPNLFTWSIHSTICLFLIITMASIRLLAYAQLGANFTYTLAKPQSLITSGLYAYVQHPSYSSNMVVLIGNALMFERPDGVLGCWLSEGVVGSVWWTVLGWVLLGLSVWSLRVRVKDEERIMREAFGREWEVWHGKTARFVPGVW